MTDSIDDYLLRDHDALRALLARAAGAEAFDAAAFDAFRRRLLRHIAIEEKVLLPAARAALGAPISRAREMRVQHGAIASLLVPTPDHALVAELRALLTAHDALEEGDVGVYAECARILGAERALELGALAASHPEVPAAPHHDGAHVVRTAADALEVARRMRFRDDKREA